MRSRRVWVLVHTIEVEQAGYEVALTATDGVTHAYDMDVEFVERLLGIATDRDELPGSDHLDEGKEEEQFGVAVGRRGAPIGEGIVRLVRMEEKDVPEHVGLVDDLQPEGSLAALTECGRKIKLYGPAPLRNKRSTNKLTLEERRVTPMKFELGKPVHLYDNIKIR